MENFIFCAVRALFSNDIFGRFIAIYLPSVAPMICSRS